MQPEDLYDATSLAHDFGSVSRETLSRLELYGELLVKWNKSINLVSRDSLRDLWRRHFLDSAQLLEYIPTSSTGSAPVLVDLGSGAGFPGLVLAILGAGDVHLIEADQRKAVFLREVARETECQVTVHNKRIEQVETFAADVVTARAFAPMGDLLEYAWPFLSCRTEKSAPTNDTDTPRNGCLLLLKGKNVDQELTDAGKRWSMHVERFSSRSSIEGQILRLDALPIGD